jgi:hypothetical protein
MVPGAHFSSPICRRCYVMVVGRVEVAVEAVGHVGLVVVVVAMSLLWWLDGTMMVVIATYSSCSLV